MKPEPFDCECAAITCFNVWDRCVSCGGRKKAPMPKDPAALMAPSAERELPSVENANGEHVVRIDIKYWDGKKYGEWQRESEIVRSHPFRLRATSRSGY